jgi:hypothetical protein
MRMKHIWLCVTAFALMAACSKEAAKRPPAHKRPGELHVYVDTTGAIELEGRAMSLDSVKTVLAAQKAAGKVVLYTRERPGNPPTPAQWVVFAQVRELGLPIRFEGDSLAYVLTDSQ